MNRNIFDSTFPYLDKGSLKGAGVTPKKKQRKTKKRKRKKKKKTESEEKTSLPKWSIIECLLKLDANFVRNTLYVTHRTYPRA